MHLPDALRRLLCQVVLFTFDHMRDVQPQFAEFLAHGLAGDPQQEGGLLLTPPGVLQDAGQQEPVQLAVRFRIQVADVGSEPWADGECLQARLLPEGCGTRCEGRESCPSPLVAQSSSLGSRPSPLKWVGEKCWK